MPALFFLLLFWLLPVLIGLGLGYLLDWRRAHTVGKATRSCCGMVVIQTRDDAPAATAGSPLARRGAWIRRCRTHSEGDLCHIRGLPTAGGEG